MAAAAGIFNHAMTAGQALTGTAATPMDSSTTGTTGTSGTDSSDDGSGDSATISANDFLTLLVTEMQNQDPTADTDPNEYIDQLVQVNSLEQLIDINQTLSTDVGSTVASSGTGSSAQVAGTPNGPTGASAPAAAATAHMAHAPGALSSALSAFSSGGAPATQTAAAGRAPGNLGVPRVNAAARRVAHALDGRTHAQPGSGGTIAAQ
jgi:flagellar basal-body rod modification protein FlgD